MLSKNVILTNSICLVSFRCLMTYNLWELFNAKAIPIEEREMVLFNR